jgi:hypothetical protein
MHGKIYAPVDSQKTDMPLNVKYVILQIAAIYVFVARQNTKINNFAESVTIRGIYAPAVLQKINAL